MELTQTQHSNQTPAIDYSIVSIEPAGYYSAKQNIVFRDSAVRLGSVKVPREHTHEFGGVADWHPEHESPVPTVAIDWETDCADLYRNRKVLEELNPEFGWPADFGEILARAGVIGLHDGRICFPLVAGVIGPVVGRIIFHWPGAYEYLDYKDPKSWHEPDAPNVPLVIGARDFKGVNRVYITPSYFEAVDLLQERGWQGEPLQEPIIVAPDENISGVVTTWISSVTEVIVRLSEFPRAGWWAERWLRALFARLPASVRSCQVQLGPPPKTQAAQDDLPFDSEIPF